MAKNDNPHAVRLLESLASFGKQEDAEALASTLTKNWCYCTLGYTKRMFEYIFDREFQVELLGSVKTDSDCCRIKVMID